MRAVRWGSECGLAAGTLLKVRLVEKAPSSPVDVSNLKLDENPITEVDTFGRVTFSAADGAPRDVSRVKLTVPATVPGAAPAAAPHALYVIVDTSGSTGMRVGGGAECFLDKSKQLLDAILRALPEHVAALRGANAINGAPITVRLWTFDQNTTKQHEVLLSAGADGGAVLGPVRATVGTLRPGGCTNYDSWASELRAAVGTSPSSLHSVLLVTDGGATQRERFFGAIEAIASQPGVGFFQCDALGYGPWLDPRTVTFLASATGGEAMMVESLEGEGTHKKVLGLLARSMLRAASRMTLRIAGGRLLAVRADAAAADEAAPPPPKASVDALTIDAITSAAHGADDSAAFTLEVLPTAKLCLSIDHPAGRPPELTIGGHALPWPAAAPATPEWEMVTHSDASAPPPAAALSVLEKLRTPATAQALRHLPLLEPAYAPPKSTSYPDETAAARAAACLAISLKGQLVAPSVTKGVAVATLETKLEPVPEHCRPKPSALGKAYESLGEFEDDNAGFDDDDDLMSAGACFGAPQRRGCAKGMARSRGAASGGFGGGMMQMMGGGGGGAFGAMPAAASACFGAAGAAPPMPAGGAPPPPGAAPFGAPAPPPPQPKAMKKKVARPPPRQPGFGGEEEAPAGPPPLSKWVGLTRGGLYVSDTATLPITGTITSAAATPTTQRLSSRATSPTPSPRSLRSSSSPLARRQGRPPPRRAVRLST